MLQKDTQNKEQEYGNREVKSTAFTAYFGEKKNAAALYDSISGTENTSPEEIEYETLEGVLFMARKNDLAFLARQRVLVISEHQSTVNENMPLRDVIYYGRTMEKLIPPRAMYRRKQIQIPTPEFYVFYNGKEEYPKEKLLYLSDAFLEKRESYMAEVTVKVININLQKEHPLLGRCRPLYEYSAFMEYIREYEAIGLPKKRSIERGIQKCRQMGIMTDFLDKHGSEVENMLFTQFNWKDAKEAWQEEAFEDGRIEGRAEGIAEGKAEERAAVILELLAAAGEVPDTLSDQIYAERDEAVMRKWTALAAKAGSIQEFEQGM